MTDIDRYERYPCDPRPSHLYVYWVTGRGEFPFDMLRYDGCWPCDTESAFKMTERSREPRSIQLHAHRPPTIGRWASFLWAVGRHKL